MLLIGALPRYLKEQLHGHKGEVDLLRNHIRDLYESKCRGRLDDLLCDELLSQFWERFHALKAHPEQCCRMTMKRAEKKRNRDIKWPF